LVGCLAKVLDSRDGTSPEVAAAGMLVNTMGYIDGLGYELLADAVTQLRVGWLVLVGV
jgi:polyribonucleotide 5'-hydroxyl-kinase